MNYLFVVVIICNGLNNGFAEFGVHLEASPYCRPALIGDVLKQLACREDGNLPFLAIGREWSRNQGQQVFDDTRSGMSGKQAKDWTKR